MHKFRKYVLVLSLFLTTWVLLYKEFKDGSYGTDEGIMTLFFAIPVTIVVLHVWNRLAKKFNF